MGRDRGHFHRRLLHERRVEDLAAAVSKRAERPKAGPSAPFAALTLRPTSAAMSPIDVSRSHPPPLLQV
jgi:hypothetical protein